MTTAAAHASQPRRAVHFEFSRIALAALILGIALTTMPAGRADVAIAGFVVLWLALIGFMRRSGTTMRYWATLMTAVLVWFALASVSGSLTRWTQGSAATARAVEPARVVTRGVDLKAEVRFTPAGLVISNRSRQSWENISLTLNGASAGTYTAHLDRVPAGRTLSVPPSRFVAADGQPFDAASAQPESLVLAAHLGTEGPSGALEVRWR